MVDNNLQVLSYLAIGDREIPIYGSADEPLFKSADVASVLGHKNTSMLTKNVNDNEKGVISIYTLGGKQNVSVLTERGLYEVLMQSRKPVAKDFKSNVKDILHKLRTEGKVDLTKQVPSRVIGEKEDIINAHYAALNYKREWFKLSDESFAAMVNNTDKALGIQGQHIDYLPSQGVAQSATALLKAHGCGISTIEFNKRMYDAGYMTKHIHHGKKDKPFYQLNEKGLAYGKNDVNPDHPERVQVHYFEDKFSDLLTTVGIV